MFIPTQKLRQRRILEIDAVATRVCGCWIKRREAADILALLRSRRLDEWNDQDRNLYPCFVAYPLPIEMQSSPPLLPVGRH